MFHWMMSAWNRDPLSVLALFVAVLSMIFTGLQWRAATLATKISERAWVGPTGTVNILGTIPIQAGPPVAFEVIVINTGKTPALEVETNIMARSLPIGTNFVPDYPPTPGALPHYRGKTAIQPGMQVTLTTQPTIPITGEAIDALRNSRIVFRIYGKIDYKDIFGQKHHTTFCMFLHPTLDRMSACKEYNTVD